MLLVLDTPLSGGGGLILADPTAAPIAGIAAGALPAILGGAGAAYVPPVVASGAGTFPVLTGAAAALVTEPVVGTGAGVLPGIIGAAVAGVTEPVSGVAGGTLPALAGAAAATLSWAGAVAGTLPALAGAASATLSWSGSAVGGLPALAGTASATFAAAPVTGVASGALPALTGHASDVTPEVVVPFGPGETFLTLAAAVAGTVGVHDPVADDIILVFEATSAFTDTAPVGLNTTFPNNAAYGTDATHPIIIRAAPGARHTGAYAGGYRLSAAGNTVTGLNLLDIDRANVIVRDVEIDGAGSVGGTTAACVRVRASAFNSSPATLLLERCLVHGSNGDGLVVNTDAAGRNDAVVVNCAVAHNTAAGVAVGMGGYTAGRVRLVGTTLAYNGTSLNPFGGWEFEATGCLSAHNTTEWISGTFNPGTSDWNTTTGAYTPGANGQANATVAFVAPLAGDYRVTNGTYAGFTAKPSAAVVAAAVAGWPDVAWFDVDVDLAAFQRPDPHQPGALGVVPVEGFAAGALPSLIGAASAVFAPPITGAVAGVLPSLTGAATGTVTEPTTGILAGVLPALTGAAAGAFSAAVETVPHTVLRVWPDALAVRVGPDALAVSVQPETLGVTVR